MIDENTSRQVEELYRSDDWAELRWAREHSTPQQIARHLLDPQWRNRDYNALDELVEMTHDADLSSLDEDDLETLAASGLPELRQAIIRYAGTPARLLEDMARTESNTRLLQMLVESGKLSQNAIDLCCWNQTDSRLAASMLTKASDDLLHRLSGRDWWPSRKNAVESGRLDRKDLDDMIKTENHPDVVSALIGTGEFDMDSEAEAIRRVITSPGLLTAYTNPMNRRYSLDQSRQEVVRQAARTMLEHAPVGMILSMPDDDDENWRTLIDTAATEYAGELGKDMLGLIAQSESNTQARTILAGRGFPKAAASNAERTLAASPGADGTCRGHGRGAGDGRRIIHGYAGANGRVGAGTRGGRAVFRYGGRNGFHAGAHSQKDRAVRHQGRPVRGRPAHPTWSRTRSDRGHSRLVRSQPAERHGKRGGPTGRGARARIRAGQDGGGCDAVRRRGR